MRAVVSNPTISRSLLGAVYPVLLEVVDGASRFSIELTADQARALAWDLKDKAAINDEEWEARQARKDAKRVEHADVG